MKHTASILLSVFYMGICTSCTVIHHEVENHKLANKISETYQPQLTDNPAQKQKRPTSRAEVIELLGPPHKMGKLNNQRYAFGYEYRDVSEHQLGIAIPGFSILKLVLGKAGSGRHTLIIEFSSNHQILAAGSAQWHENVGFGSNLQILFSVAPTTDTQGIRERWNTESWTTDLLHTPVGLVDLSHDPDAGDSGIRFSGMPKPDLRWPAQHTGRH